MTFVITPHGKVKIGSGPNRPEEGKPLPPNTQPPQKPGRQSPLKIFDEIKQEAPTIRQTNTDRIAAISA